ncbi:hypothetical protein WJ39_27255 [Burkholderia diffusa]|nr:hypothetical protein WJ39_27255 [Burkholderia diffusa]
MLTDPVGRIDLFSGGNFRNGFAATYMNLFESPSNNFRAGFAAALAAEEFAQALDQAQHLAELGLGRLTDIGQQIRTANFINIEEQSGIQIGATATHVHQMDQATTRNCASAQCSIR